MSPLILIRNALETFAIIRPTMMIIAVTRDGLETVLEYLCCYYQRQFARSHNAPLPKAAFPACDVSACCRTGCGWLVSVDVRCSTNYEEERAKCPNPQRRCCCGCSEPRCWFQQPASTSQVWHLSASVSLEKTKFQTAR